MLVSCLVVYRYSAKLSRKGTNGHNSAPLITMCINSMSKLQSSSTRRPPPGTVRPRTDGPGKKVKIGQFVRISTGDWWCLVQYWHCVSLHDPVSELLSSRWHTLAGHVKICSHHINQVNRWQIHKTFDIIIYINSFVRYLVSRDP